MAGKTGSTTSRARTQKAGITGKEKPEESRAGTFTGPGAEKPAVDPQTTTPATTEGKSKPQPGTIEGNIEGLHVEERRVETPETIPDFPRETAPKETKKPVKGKDDPVTQAVETFILIANGMAEMNAGPEAVMTPMERTMISEPLRRIIERYDIDLEGKLSKYADPVILIFGILAWISRVKEVSTNKTPPEEKSSELVEKANHKSGVQPQKVSKDEIDYSNLGPPDNIRRMVG